MNPLLRIGAMRSPDELRRSVVRGGAGRRRTGRVASVLGLASAASLFLVGRAAHANPADLLGYDVDASAAAGARLVFGHSAGVTYSNPALLVDAPPQLEIGLALRSPHLYARPFSKPAGTDVPISIYDSTVGTAVGVSSRALPTSELQQRRSSTAIEGTDADMTFGFVTRTPIEGLKAGLSILLPATSSRTSAVSTHYEDEREAAFSNRLHFFRFGEWDRIPVATLGLAYAPLPWLALGVSTQFAATVRGRFQIYVPDATVQSYANTDASADFVIKIRPIVGARADVGKGVSLAAAWRAESYFRVDGQSQVTLWNYHEADPTRTLPKRAVQKFSITTDYEPQEVSLGVGSRFGDVTAQLDAVWQRWSRYLDGHSESPASVAVLPGDTGGPIRAYALSNTIGWQGSLDWQYAPFGTATLGGAYWPSPVPPQVGRTNLVDSDLVAVTGGNRWRFSVWDRPVAVSVHLGMWKMSTRTTHKDPAQIADEFPDNARSLRSNASLAEAKGLQSNNPGFPGYRAEGALLSGGVSLSTELR